VEEEIKPLDLTPKMVGLDLGLKSMVITSDGHRHANPKFAAYEEKKLARASRQLSKKKKGSKNRAKARKKVATIHARIADRRRDYQHKLSTQLIRENQTICVESLHVKNMVHNHSLAQAISDVGWGEFVRQLEYKARWYGRTLVKIDKFYPSSKRCHACGHLLDSLSLEIRHWVCPACGVAHDRDLNAASNILAAGLVVAGVARVCQTWPGESSTRQDSLNKERPLVRVGIPSPKSGTGGCQICESFSGLAMRRTV
jgi:putative transposase